MMPSPFPGMDPFLEDPRQWADVHLELVVLIRRELNRQLLPRYVVAIRERVYVAEDEDSNGTIFETEVHDARLEIVRPGTNDAVTVIEILKPPHKTKGGSGRAAYLETRNDLLRSEVNLVEIDLLRSGSRIRLPGPRLPEYDYAVTASLAEKRSELMLWPIQLSERLPTIPIPLTANEPGAMVDLQSVLATAFEDAWYDGDIDYRSDPAPPPLSDEQLAWMHEVLTSAGLR